VQARQAGGRVQQSRVTPHAMCPRSPACTLQVVEYALWHMLTLRRVPWSITCHWAARALKGRAGPAGAA
jgi:hypothetical protein